ncbi:hypothetical protein D9M71_402910 [compost metagenome]
MRTPAIPEKLDHGDNNRQTDTRDRTEHHHPDKAGNRQPALPTLDTVDPLQVLDLEQANSGGDHHGGKRAVGQVL